MDDRNNNKIYYCHLCRYGYLTWEWVYNIRSYIYVSWIAILYKVLQIIHLDTVQNLTILPCIVQGLFSAIADTFFIKWVFKISVYPRQAFWSVWCYMTNVFLAYCATRTLTNTMEMNLTCIALYYYPWSQAETGEIWMTIVLWKMMRWLLKYEFYSRQHKVFLVRLFILRY